MRSLFEILLLFLFIMLAVAVLLLVVLGPQYAEKITPPEEEPEEQLPPDWLRYFQLRNASCGTLSDDFLIVTDDVSNASLQGLVESVPGEREAAQRIAASYHSEQTTKTYVRGDWMKKVVISGGKEGTTIWKEGRVYECEGNCTMRLMDEQESSEFYDKLYEMKVGCAYLGKTRLPDSVDMARLITINKTGVMDIDSFRCDNFLISANRSYAEELLANETLDSGQRTLVWALAHLEGPLQECLDESTGIIVYRNITLDLTDAYLFDYNPGGYMKVNQQTTLTYFTDTVPESFLGLPQN